MAAIPTVSDNEKQRLEVLRGYGVLDTPAEGLFDDLIALASRSCRAPYVSLSLLDADREWFRGTIGLPSADLPRSCAISAPVVCTGKRVTVPDMTRDPRLNSHPFVMSDPRVQAYAAMPLITAGGHVLGALAIMDRAPREFSDDELCSLAGITRQVMALLELRRGIVSLRREMADRERIQQAQAAVENERNAFLLDLSTEVSRISHPQDLVCVAMLRLRCRLNATSVALAEVTPDEGEALLLTQGAPDDASRMEVSNIPVDALKELCAVDPHGKTTVICDTKTDARSFRVYQTWHQPRGMRAVMSVPLLRGGSLVALLSVIHSEPRNWSGAEIELTRRVADIVWPALEKARADRALMMSEERLRLAQNIARIGAWEWDPDNGHTFLSAECRELFGFDSDGHHSFTEVFQRVDPRDTQDVQAALARCRETGGGELDYRIRHPRLGARWIHAKAGMTVRSGRPCMVGICLDVTERREAEEALKDVNQRKDEFLAMLAHELRNPLAPIRNAAQILRVHGKDNAQLDWARSVIERQARHLTRLVDDLLDVSRIVRGQIALEKTRVDLGEVVRYAVETSRPLIRERCHEIEVQLPAEPICFDGDLTRLAQVVANLLINAAKYTNAGGEIRVTAEREGFNHAVLKVRDTGAGIPENLLPHIFDLFTQGERTLDRSQGGLGIGLTLVKRIVEMHGGTVEARSEGSGKGSEFMRQRFLRRLS